MAFSAEPPVKIDFHGKRYLMRVVPLIVVVDMQRLQLIAQSLNHLDGRRIGSLHFGMTDIEARDEGIVVHGLQMRAKALRRGAGGEGGAVLFRVPVPHVFGGDFDAAPFRKGQQLPVHVRVFLGRLIVIRMDDADLSPRLRGALDGPLKIGADFPAAAWEGRVRLIAHDAVVLSHPPQLSGEGQIAAAASG